MSALKIVCKRKSNRRLRKNLHVTILLQSAAPDWFLLVLATFLLHSADKDQQEMRAVAEKPHDVIVKLDTYRNGQRHRAVLPAIA